MRALCAPLLVLAAGCGPSDGSIVLRFPSEAARQATKTIELYAVRDPLSSERAQCATLLAKLPREEPLGLDLITEPFALPLEGSRTISGFPAGAPVVFVVGLDAAENRLFQGCSDHFGLELGNQGVDVPLTAILPAGVFLERVGGGRQVGGPGGTLAEPLRARARAVSVRARSAPYNLPGVALELAVDLPGALLGGRGPPTTVLTDEEGLISVEVTLPQALGSGAVLVTSAALLGACTDLGGPGAARDCPQQTSQRFELSVVPDLSPLDARVAGLEPAGIDALIDVAVGDVVGGPGLDAVLLGCRGDPAACADGTGGTTQLFTAASIGRVTAAPVAISGPLGIAPGALYLGPFFPGVPETLVVLNRRRADCQDRVDPVTQLRAPCEGSEVLALTSEGQTLSAPRRTSLTASNAVGLAALPFAGGTRLFTAGQGVRSYSRSCRDTPMCRPEHEYVCADGRADCTSYCFARQNVEDPAARQEFAATCVDLCRDHPEACGCAPGETCLPHPLDATLGLRCVPQDKIVDQLLAGPGGPENYQGCQMRRAECLKDKSSPSRCACLDAFRGNRCAGSDDCGCSVPEQILVGGGSGSIPRDLALAEGSAGPDLVVASNAGIELLPGTPAGTFTWELRRSPVVSTDGIRLLDLDGEGATDILWWSREPCGATSTDCPWSRSPDARGLLDGAPVRGCAGLMLRRVARPIGALAEDGCHRFGLPFRPDGSCSADLSGDGKVDVVFSSFESAELLVYLGDGRGGLRDPPAKVPLPSGTTGGRLVCRDIDGDAKADVVVAGPKGQLITLLQK